MEKLSKILMVICILFIIVGIYWLFKTRLDLFSVKAFFLTKINILFESVFINRYND